MLLSAQRVRAHDGREGINVAGYLHGPAASAVLATNPHAAFQIQIPRTLLLTLPALPGGGHRVISFLDVAFADAVSSRIVAAGLPRLVATWRPEMRPATILQSPPLAAHFYCSPEVDAGMELRDLHSALRPVAGYLVPSITRTPIAPVQPTQPFRIVMTTGPRGRRYVLDAVSRQRLNVTTPVDPPQSFSIADEMLDDFMRYALMPIETIVVESLTALPLDTVNALGGAVILDGESGTQLWASIDQ